MNKIKLIKGSWGNWYCELESDNGKGDFGVQKINDKCINFDREELIVAALKKLGVEVEYVV